MTQPLRNHGGHGGATAIYVVQAPQWHRAFGVMGGNTTDARRNMLKVSAVPPRRSAVLTVFGGATAINDGTTAEPQRSWRCHCGLCRTSTAVAPRLRCDGGISLSGLLTTCRHHFGQRPHAQCNSIVSFLQRGRVTSHLRGNAMKQCTVEPLFYDHPQNQIGVVVKEGWSSTRGLTIL